MATVRKLPYFVLQAAHKPGEGARLLKDLKKHGVNLLAFSAFPSAGGAQVDLFPQDPAALRSAAKKLGLKLSEKKTGFLLQGTDRPGALVGVLDKLGKAGINVTALDAASAGWKRYGAMFWVKPDDVARAARLLRAK